MSKTILRISLMLNLIAHAQEHSSTVQNKELHPVNVKPSMGQAKAIFEKKCQVCHEGDGKFSDDSLPSSEWQEKILDAINHKAGVRPMPPPSSKQLSEEELSRINSWAGRGIVPPASSCANPLPSPSSKVVEGIFADRCVTCHGKMSLNPTSILRPGHHQFFNNDGSFDRTVLGDMGELKASQMPQNKSSLARILDSLAGYTMPPRANLPVLNHPSDSMHSQLGTPTLSEIERTFLVSAMKAIIQQENCPPKAWVSIVHSKNNTIVKENFKKAERDCAVQGMHIPSAKQLEAMESSITSSNSGENCIWSSTFDKTSTKVSALRKGLVFREGKVNYLSFDEGKKCQVFCAK